jgi:hypothetical protein
MRKKARKEQQGAEEYAHHMEVKKAYQEGYDAGHSIAQSAADAYEVAKKESRRELTLEFGDSQVTVFDGADEPLVRIPLWNGDARIEASWQHRISELIAHREATVIKARLGIHLLITLEETASKIRDDVLSKLGHRSIKLNGDETQ